MAKDNNMNIGSVETGAPSFILSSNPQKAMQEMMDTIDALRTIYVEETAALEKSDTHLFMKLQDSKIATAHRYQNGISQIVARKEEFRNSDPALRTRLNNMHEEFIALTAKNMAALERVNRGVRMLSDRIMSAARDAADKEAVNYGNRGALNKYKGPLSIGLSEQA